MSEDVFRAFHDVKAVEYYIDDQIDKAPAELTNIWRKKENRIGRFCGIIFRSVK